MKTAITSLTVILGSIVVTGAVHGQTQDLSKIIFTDTFDGGFSTAIWTPIEGKINNIAYHKLEGSINSGNHDHTGNGGQAAVAYPANPTPYGAFYEWPAQGVNTPMKVAAWIFDEGHDTYCETEDMYAAQTVTTTSTRSFVGVATQHGGVNIADPPNGAWGPNVIYEYEDFAWLGVDIMNPTYPNPGGQFDPNQADPALAEYQWYTKTDGWNSTGVPRKTNTACGGSTDWHHFEIVINPYTGQAGDIEFYIDGQLVGQGHRAAGTGGNGAEFRRMTLGTRIPQNSDILGSFGPPLYSYEFYRFDDVEISLPLTCNEPRFDIDGDGDVDQTDFGAFQLCLTGVDDPNGAFVFSDCGCMDSDGDEDVDGDDLTGFLNCVSGPSIDADPACDDPPAS